MKCSRGFSLLEACASMGILAVFVAVFLSLSSRLASSTSQQTSRAQAMAYLDAILQETRTLGPETWKLPISRTVHHNGVSYQIKVVQSKTPFPADGKFGVLQGTVVWDSVTGKQQFQREMWVHARLD